MTPQELIRIAKNINPKKFEEDPQAALEDAYIVWEAVRLVELEKVSHYLPPAEEANIRGTLYLPKRRRKKDPDFHAVERLKIQIDHGGDNGHDVAKKLGVSAATVYAWLSGKSKPNAANIAKIEAYLREG